MSWIAIIGVFTTAFLMGSFVENWLIERSLRKENNKLSESFERASRRED